MTTEYEYDGMSRLKRLKDVSTSATLFDRQYDYNTASQINQIAEPTQTRTFGYDNVDRLTSMTNGTANESYSFDDVGNRTSSHRSATYTYQSGQFNRVASTATANYAYDANGNLTSKSEGSKRWIYFWDYENRLTMAWDRKQRVRYLYDALGRRVQRYIVGNKENTKFIYDGDDVLVDDNNGTLTKYINGDGIDNKLRVQTGNDVKYFLADHLGSTNALTDSSGNIASSASYDSFGNLTGNLSTRYQFTGREYDNFTGLHFYRARWYDSNLGRFISEDPIGFAGGDVNLYGYVGNKPLNFFDPFGLDEYAMMERLANTQPSNRTIGEMLDELQLMLGTVGMTPGIGEPFDAVDGIISLARGNYCDAALSGSAIIPFVGNVSGVIKLGKRGRRGTQATRDHLDKVRDEFLSKNPNYTHVGGGRNQLTGKELPEEYIPNPNGGRKGGSYPDLTFEAPDGSRIRINTVDTYKNNSPTNRELDNAYRINRNTNEPIILVPKPK